MVPVVELFPGQSVTVSRGRVDQSGSGMCSESPPVDLEVEAVISNYRVKSQTDNRDVLKARDRRSRSMSLHANNGME